MKTIKQIAIDIELYYLLQSKAGQAHMSAPQFLNEILTEILKQKKDER